MKNFHLIIFLLICFLLASQGSVAQKSKRESASAAQVADPDKSAAYFIEGEKYFILEDFAKAYVLFKKAAEYDAENAAARFKLAEILIKSQDYEKALPYARQALALDPQNKFYYLINAEIYTKQANFKAAIAVYKNMLASIADTDAYLFDLAALYLYQDDLEGALEVYDEIEARFGVKPQIAYQKQKIYLKLNDLESAVQEGEKLIKANPGEEEYVFRLVEILMSNGRLEKAEVHLKGLLEKDTANAHARLMLAEVYKQNNQEEAAHKNLLLAFSSDEIALEPKLQVMTSYISQLPDPEVEAFTERLAGSIIQAHPDEADAYTISGDLYYTLDDKQKAVDYYLKSLVINSDNFAVWQNVLDLELRLNQMDSVVRHADQALELFPNQAALYYFSGTANLIKKNYEAAVAALGQGKRFASGNDKLMAVFNAQLGDAYNSLEQYAQSDAAYEAVLQVDPQNSHVLNNYAYFLALRKENLDKALEMSSKLVALHPEDPTFLDTHAWVLYTLGEYKEAKKVLEKAIHEAESGTIIEHYGDVLFQLGKTEEAVIQWKRAKGMDDTSEMIDKKIADRKLYE